jgi:hypothetical protein
MKKRTGIIFCGIFFLIFPALVRGASLGDSTNFFVQSSYDISQRDEISASLRATCDKAYFYVDDNWWNDVPIAEKTGVYNNLKSLATEFCTKIYPTLTSEFGYEWKPGIDQDEKITVLLQEMEEGDGGYFNSGDEYSKIQNPSSNQREMVYLNASYLASSNAKAYLAHEFVHLITFNQKEKNYGVSEENWLNEARAEYAPTLLGYDKVYEGSYLQNRVRIFLEKPTDSLTEWSNTKEDYGTLNVFTQYLVEHYGIKILSDSLRSKKVGIASINEALSKDGFDEDFSRIFTNWTVAVFLNSCVSGEGYCYTSANLSNLRIVPSIYFLSLVGESSFSINYSAPEWAGNWYKIIGGKGNLALEFNGSDSGNFRVFYLLCDYQGSCQVNQMTLDSGENGEITINDFNAKYSSLVLIPSVQPPAGTLSNVSYSFSWKASVAEKTGNNQGTNEDLIQTLLAQIEYLKKEIARLKALQAGSSSGSSDLTCGKFETDLSYGMSGNSQVSCLQQFLKGKGAAIYPEGLVTGNFYSATLAAVKRYQALKGITQTGYFGPLTRAAANSGL